MNWIAIAIGTLPIGILIYLGWLVVTAIHGSEHEEDNFDE